MTELSLKQKQQYDEKGYLLLKNIFTDDEISPLVEEIEQSIDEIAISYIEQDKIHSLYENDGFGTRFNRIVNDSEDAYDELVGSVHLGPALFDLLSNHKVLDIVESILGPEIRCEGRHRIRPKLPNYDVADFRWHEDTAYSAKRITYTRQHYGLSADHKEHSGSFLSKIVAAPQMPEPNFWIPLVSVNEKNGCLHVLPGGHKHTPPYENQWTPESFIPELTGLKPLIIPMEVGDALLMHQHLPHVSPGNKSDTIRWSVDIRYQDAMKPIKSLKEPGFIARSSKNTNKVIANYQDYENIRRAVKEFAAKIGLPL